MERFTAKNSFSNYFHFQVKESLALQFDRYGTFVLVLLNLSLKMKIMMLF